MDVNGTFGWRGEGNVSQWGDEEEQRREANWRGGRKKEGGKKGKCIKREGEVGGDEEIKAVYWERG